MFYCDSQFPFYYSKILQIEWKHAENSLDLDLANLSNVSMGSGLNDTGSIGHSI